MSSAPRYATLQTEDVASRYNRPFVGPTEEATCGRAYTFSLPVDMAYSLLTLKGDLANCPVLIVEDDADLREMMAQLLTLEGFSAATVSNGREALKYLEDRQRPELILLDLMMPVMDGWEFRRRQQANPELSHVPVIVLSALDQARANGLHAEAFLKKPLDFDRLLELVRQYCQ